jgi:hypothetical protein
MSLEHIQDRIRWGLNVAARNIGATTDAYRPSGVVAPIAVGGGLEPRTDGDVGVVTSGPPWLAGGWGILVVRLR